MRERSKRPENLVWRRVIREKAMKSAPKILELSDKIYRAFLRLYPESHRREFGEPMAQLFRDQCRDAWSAGHFAGLLRLWLRTLPDVGKTLVVEQIAAIERNIIMKHFPTLLLIAGLALAFLSLSPMAVHSGPIFVLLTIASSLANLGKAFVELLRPACEYGWILFRTFVLLFCYAMILPAWAHIKVKFGMPAGIDPLGFFIMTFLFANPVVAAIKVGQHFMKNLHLKR